MFDYTAFSSITNVMIKKRRLNCICTWILSHFWPLLAASTAVCVYFVGKAMKCFSFVVLATSVFWFYELSHSAMHMSAYWQWTHIGQDHSVKGLLHAID